MRTAPTYIAIPEGMIDPVIGRLARRGWRYDEDFTAYYVGCWELVGIIVYESAIVNALRKGIETDNGRFQWEIPAPCWVCGRHESEHVDTDYGEDGCCTREK